MGLYYDIKMSQEQKKYSLMAAFFDPRTYPYLNDSDKEVVHTKLVTQFGKNRPSTRLGTLIFFSKMFF